MVTFADRLVLYVLVGAGLVLLLTGGGRAPGAAARIEGAEGFELVLPLDRWKKVDVPGPLGSTTVEIYHGAARVLWSACPHGYCIRMGEVRTPGQSIVCVPNRVVVTIVGDAAAATDVITR